MASNLTLVNGNGGSKQPYTECIICNKPLGADSKDSGFRTCLDHRECIKCGRSLNAREIQWCHEKLIDHNETIEEIELIHPRCLSVNHPTLEQDPTLAIKQSEYDYLNLCRLAITPNLDLSIVTNENNAMIQELRLISNMTFDEKLVHLRMLEACVAQSAIALRQDPAWRKDAYSEREKKQVKRAQAEKLTSARPESKKDNPEDAVEMSLGLFMENHGIKERTAAMKIWRDRERSVQSMVKAFGLAEIDARKLATDAMIKSGVLQAPAEPAEPKN